MKPSYELLAWRPGFEPDEDDLRLGLPTGDLERRVFEDKGDAICEARELQREGYHVQLNRVRRESLQTWFAIGRGV